MNEIGEFDPLCTADPRNNSFGGDQKSAFNLLWLHMGPSKQGREQRRYWPCMIVGTKSHVNRIPILPGTRDRAQSFLLLVMRRDVPNMYPYADGYGKESKKSGFFLLLFGHARGPRGDAPDPPGLLSHRFARPGHLHISYALI